MATSDTTAQPPPLIREGSNVFAAIAVSVLLVGGVAGIASDGGQVARTTAASASDHSGEHAAGLDATADHGHGGTGVPGHPPDAALRPAGHDAHGTSVAGAHADAAPGHDAIVDGASAEHDAGAPHDTGAPHDAAGAAADHGAHGAEGAAGSHDAHGAGEAAAGGEHHHATGCADDHPATIGLVGAVQGELATTYKDVAALVALGYHPYFDSLVPGGYPPGGEGISHWINPNYIDDGVVLDPHRPETILLDDWYWPIGMMFINDPGIPPVPVYVNADGTSCSPWHPHTDAPARFGWYYYRAVYDRELEGDVPAQTPEMMHVWAVPNPAGVYAAHDYPPSEVRAGPPGPLPSYFSDASVPGD